MIKTITVAGGIALATLGSIAAAQPAPPPPPAPPTRVWAEQTMTRADVVARVRTMFERMDTNHDGVLTQDEVSGPRGGGGQRTIVMRRPQGDMGTMPPLPPMAPGQSFDTVDRDHNGVITRDEYAQQPAGGVRSVQVIRIHPGDGPMSDQGMARGKGRGMHGMGMGGMGMGMRGAMFGMADANHDGRVTLNEATAAALQHFDMMDRNHDGRITPDERPAMRGQMQN